MKPHGANMTPTWRRPQSRLGNRATQTGFLPHKEEPRLLNAAGVRRRVIEGEGLGGFARRLTVNDLAEGLFLAR